MHVRLHVRAQRDVDHLDPLGRRLQRPHVRKDVRLVHGLLGRLGQRVVGLTLERGLVRALRDAQLQRGDLGCVVDAAPVLALVEVRERLMVGDVHKLARAGLADLVLQPHVLAEEDAVLEPAQLGLALLQHLGGRLVRLPQLRHAVHHVRRVEQHGHVAAVLAEEGVVLRVLDVEPLADRRDHVVAARARPDLERLLARVREGDLDKEGAVQDRVDLVRRWHAQTHAKAFDHVELLLAAQRRLVEVVLLLQAVELKVLAQVRVERARAWEAAQAQLEQLPAHADALALSARVARRLLDDLAVQLVSQEVSLQPAQDDPLAKLGRRAAG
eukprot:Unigene4102_Nuclearia_a/m.12482 Unigene4102_Nuclearia_a/g.12482  ORF Unigene4102_Nuclearia_a/g.12482 Unigene4102_Nuclearia_a/m.12482 type:complete len:328 (+) Unigene4102_Nuclearia_a:423-1406(+)